MKCFICVTIAGAAIAAILGPRGPLGGFWAPIPGPQPPQGAVFAGLVAESVIEMLAFGAGMAILLIGQEWFVARTARAVTGRLAAAWLLASWLPHSALHLHIGMQPAQLLPVEWVFHGGAIAAAAALLWAMSAAPATTRASEASGLAGAERHRTERERTAR